MVFTQREVIASNVHERGFAYCEMSRLGSLIQEQKGILDLVAADRAFEEALKAIIGSIARLQPDANGVIFLTDETGQLWVQSLSPEIESIFAGVIPNGSESAPAIGVSAAALFSGVPVSSSDVEHDGRWPVGWRQLCIARNIRAFISYPIPDPERRILGSVMLCFGRVHKAAQWEQHIAQFASSMAGTLVAHERMKRALRLQAEKVRESEQLAVVGRLYASIAHEINNPLSAIVNLLYLVAQDPSLSEPAQNYVATAQSELRRVSQITTQTLKFHRQRTAAERCSVAEIIQGLLALFRARLQASQVSIQLNEDPVEPILCHPGELRQVFANLLSNALDAMGRNGGVIQIRVRPGFVWKKGVRGVRVTIADNGQGMHAATRARIYEALFTTKSTMGTGLGLWISAEIVNKHGGTIYVRSQAGRGTTFSVALPMDGSGLVATETSAEVPQPDR